MTDLTFQLGSEVIIIRIIGYNITFANSMTNFLTFAPIDFLMLSKAGILKEFPDLINTPEAELREIAIKRFKKHIKTFKNEEEICNYVANELVKYGWILKNKRKNGWRDVKAQ